MTPPRIVSIEGHAFGSFASGFKLDLPATGLILLRGENLDTKGSSASGKSTLVHALNYGHGTCPIPLTELQSWYTRDAPKIIETYNFDGKIVQVSRGKKFEMTIDDVPFRGSADQKEEKLDQLFGTDAEMRLALTYRGQRTPGLFLSKTDSKKKEFLTRLLNLDKWEEENRKALAKVEELEDKILMANARLTDVKARLATLREMGDGRDVEAELAQVVQDIAAHEAAQRKYETAVKGMRSDAEIVADFALSLFKDEFNRVEAVVAELEKVRPARIAPPSPELIRLTQLREAALLRLKRLQDQDDEQAKGLFVQAELLRSQWQALALKAGGIHWLLADRDRVAADVKSLSNKVCPTCSREWDEVTQKLEELKDELQQINGELEELRDIQAEAAELKAEYDALPKEIEANPLIAKMEEAQSKVATDIAIEEKRLRDSVMEEYETHSTALNAARKAVQDTRDRARTAAANERSKVLAGIEGLETLAREERDKKVKLELARQRLAEQVGAVYERRRQIAALTLNAGDLLVELDPLQTQLAAEKDFAHLTGREGFRGSVFDEALEAISAETNEMLASIANTRNCTLRFESERETQEGKLRQEITPVLTINGHEKGRPSGGMLSAIEVAVDLAVGKIISERTGVCPGWLILDESFDGLGPVEKETCLEILNLYAHDRLIIVVDHASETQGLFTQRITVQCQNGVSVLK